MSKRLFVIRLGAFGDCLIITPVLREYKKRGWHITVLTSERGMDIFKNNPHVDKIKFQKSDSVHPDQLQHYWTKIAKDSRADKTINFSESLEIALALHPRDPQYNYTKRERFELCNKNYYEFTMDWAGLPAIIGTEKTNGTSPVDYYRPELFFTSGEKKQAKSYIKPGKFNIMACLTGSGKNKTYPWMEILFGSIMNEYKDVHIITVGEYIAKLIETSDPERITNLAGEIPMRVAMALTGEADLVISPDTGILHASSMYKVPKIALLGHTTPENITKYMENCTPICADPNKAECSPCFKLIYNLQLQCPTDPLTKGAWCMAKGIDPNRIFDAVKIYYSFNKKSLKENKACRVSR